MRIDAMLLLLPPAVVVEAAAVEAVVVEIDTAAASPTMKSLLTKATLADVDVGHDDTKTRAALLLLLLLLSTMKQYSEWPSMSTKQCPQ